MNINIGRLGYRIGSVGIVIAVGSTLVGGRLKLQMQAETRAQLPDTSFGCDPMSSSDATDLPFTAKGVGAAEVSQDHSLSWLASGNTMEGWAVLLANEPTTIFHGVKHKAERIKPFPAEVARLSTGLVELPLHGISKQRRRGIFEEKLNVIDILVAVAREDRGEESVEVALTGLAQAAGMSVPSGTDTDVARLAIGVRRESLTALVRLQPLRGLSVYHQLATQAQKKMFYHDVIGALTDVGLCWQKADELIKQTEANRHR